MKTKYVVKSAYLQPVKGKILRCIAACLFFLIASTGMLHAQTSEYDTSKTYVVTKNDGTQYVGKILKSDEREVLVASNTVGKLYIPKHEIKEIREVTAEDAKKGLYDPNDAFATRQFLTTNGHALGKGNNYVNYNYWGPDIEFGIGKKLSVGLMTTWLAIPLVATVKYSIELDPKIHLGIGALAGTLSWASFSSRGALPFGSLTFGSRKTNITFTGGYLVFASGTGADRIGSSNALFSLASLARISKKVSFVFDSVIIPSNSTSDNSIVAVLVPGLRINSGNGKSFQFGLAASYAYGEFIPFPIPMFSWLRTF